MKTVSKYVKNDSRFEKLESPYMNFRTTSSKDFDEMFKKFVVALSTSDAQYSIKEQEGASEEELDKIINEVKDKLNKLVAKIEKDDEKESFIEQMKKIRDCGDFGKILYNSCDILPKDIDLSKKEKEEFEKLVFVVNYLFLKGNMILKDDSFCDYDVLIIDIAHNLEKLESYVKNPEYPIEQIRSLQEKLVTLSKKLRGAKASKTSDITYADCMIETSNENLRFECEKISGLLLYLDENDELGDLYNLYYRAISFIKTLDEYNSFMQFMEQIKKSGTLGRKLYNSKLINIKELTFDLINDQKENEKEVETFKIFDDVRLTVASAVTMSQEALKEEFSLELIDDLLTLLYEQQSILQNLLKNNNNEEMVEFDGVLKKIIEFYEKRKKENTNSEQKKV